MNSSKIVKQLRILLIIFVIFIPFNYILSQLIDSSNSNFGFKYRGNLLEAGYWDLTATPILIDDSDPNYNWSKTASDNNWCSGSGTWKDPYRIENVTIDGLFSGSGIHIKNSNASFIIRNNTFIKNGRGASGWDSGILLVNVSNGLILNNNISQNEFYGIRLLESINNTISNNIVNNNTDIGLTLGYKSNNNTISTNIFNYNYDGGIGIYDSHYNNFLGNFIIQTNISLMTLSDYSTRQIELNGHDNLFSGNIFKNSGIHLDPFFMVPLSDLSSHIIDSTNLVNGKPLYYYVNKTLLSTNNFSNAGQIILVNCEDSYISDLNISHGGNGISLYYSSNNTIYNNDISYHYDDEIFLYESHQNNISQNVIKNVIHSTGIDLRNSNQNNISLNQITQCGSGIELSSSYWNTVRENNVDDNHQGIYISNSDNTDLNNIIIENVVSNSIDEGITLGIYAKSNKLYLNQFINNFKNAIDYAPINYWDNGSIGNYWDNYTGPDANDDGIGEVPHMVPGSGGNQDNFPIWDDGHNGSKIIIDGSSSNNWTWASKFTWCTGSGTLKDPYIIKNANIDANDIGSGIHIQDSSVYFRIESSNIFNAQSNYWVAGIYLLRTGNGTIIDSQVSNNNGDAIGLEDSRNNTIKNCVIEYNIGSGIIMTYYSNNNSVIDNTIRFNGGGIGISSEHSKIINNNLVDNINDGISIHPGYSNLITKNNISGSFKGFSLGGYNNTITFNTIFSNQYGIYSVGGQTWHNIIVNNSIYDQSAYGIYLSDENSRYNSIYLNNLRDNTNHAFDDGFSNYWDSGSVGNYWDDYNGLDNDDDGIGDTPYYISGLAGSRDNFPIWDDGFNGEPIYIDDLATGVGAHNWTWASTRIWSTGLGTYSNPYLIKDLTINGQGLGSSIEIRNSNKFFSIENLNVYNSGNINNIDAGIRLYNVTNGMVFQNNCSFNGRNGIILTNSNNNSIIENIVNSNNGSGILLFGEYQSCVNNTIISNNAINNLLSGIEIFNSDFNYIFKNNVKKNIIVGIQLNEGSNNLIVQNLMANNTRGIDVDSLSNNNDFYLNEFNENSVNAFDDGFNNQWDNNSHGNYWDNYLEAYPNAIPEEGIWNPPYLIIGSSGSLDHYPLVIINKPLISPSVNIIYEVGAVNNEISWNITDNSYYDSTYFIFHGLVEILNGTWISGDTIVLNVDGLSIGTYNYSIIAHDGLGSNAQYIIDVSVIARNTELEDLIIGISVISLIIIASLVGSLVVYKQLRKTATNRNIRRGEERLENIKKIKKAILGISTKFPQANILEVSEVCEIKDDKLIIQTIQEMIKNKEVHAQFFTSTNSISFSQEVNLEEIDRLMEIYRQWEEDKIGKKKS